MVVGCCGWFDFILGVVCYALRLVVAGILVCASCVGGC